MGPLQKIMKIIVLVACVCLCSCVCVWYLASFKTFGTLLVGRAFPVLFSIFYSLFIHSLRIYCRIFGIHSHAPYLVLNAPPPPLSIKFLNDTIIAGIGNVLIMKTFFFTCSRHSHLPLCLQTRPDWFKKSGTSAYLSPVKAPDHVCPN